MKRAEIDIADMLAFDNAGFVKAPNLHQIQDKDIRALYERDKGSFGDPDGTNKLRFQKEAGVIYYIADPKSPPNQSGYSYPEALALAKSNYELPANWQPDALIQRIIERYKESKGGAAAATVESALKALHISSKVCISLQDILNEALAGSPGLEDIGRISDAIKKVIDISNTIPTQMKTLNEAKSNLAYELETKKIRGGGVVTTSMSSEDSASIDELVEREKQHMGMKPSGNSNPKVNYSEYQSTK